VGLVLGAAVGSFVVRYTAGPGMADRYLFYLAPILFIGMLACLANLRRAPASIALGGLISLWVYHDHVLFAAPGSALAPAAPFHVELNRRAADLVGGLEPSTALGLAGLAVTLLLAVPRQLVAPRTVAAAVGAAVLAFCGYETVYTLRDVDKTQSKASAAYLDARDWVDRSLPDGAQAVALLGQIYDPASTPNAWWETLFFNDKLRVSYVDKKDEDVAWGQTAVQRLQVDERTGAVSGLGDARYIVRSTDDHRWGLEGAHTLVQVGNFLLQRVPAAKRVPYTLRASDQTGRVAPGDLAVLRVFTRAGQVRLGLGALPVGAPPVTVRVDGAGPVQAVTLLPGVDRTVVVRPRRRAAGQAPQVRLRAVGRHGKPGPQVMSIVPSA
jgi:hypothetical protein